ncbi:MAG: VCBS repeat-containing protein [Bacteroidales bacterium]|nr:VCBS repeat-containing protein [Bacteroidales bacterium]
MKRNVVLLLCLTFLLFCASAQESGPSSVLTEPLPLRFNNPGLVTDLGVGLWAWPLPMDYDNDGDNDLVVSCTDTPYRGLYFFENSSGKHEKLPVFEPPVRIGPGLSQLQVSYVGGEPRVLGRGVEYLHFRDSLVSVPGELFPAAVLEKGLNRVRFSQWKYVDYDNDGDQDLIAGVDDWTDYGWDNAFDSTGKWYKGPLHGYVFLLENTEGKYFNKGKIRAGGKDLDVYGAPSPNMADFDGDGDRDLICGEFTDRFTWFENTGTPQKPLFEEGRFLENEKGLITMDLEMIIPSSIDWDNDGDIDIICGDEDGRVAFIENTGIVRNRMPVFSSPAYFRQKADLLKFGALATPFSVDWDDDGDEDLICGNTAGFIGFIENLDGGNPPRWNDPVLLEVDGKPFRIMAGENGSIQGPAEKKWGYTTLSVADWDGDGLKDIIVNSIWGRVEWLRNIGKKGRPALSAPVPVVADWPGDPPKPAWNWWFPEKGQLATQWRTTPYITDWNRDGLNDLIMLDHEGYLSYFERFKKENELYLRQGRRIFFSAGNSVFDQKNNVIDSAAGPLRLNNRIAGGSGRRKICLADWDCDGDDDLIVNGINAAWFENTGVIDEKVIMLFRGNLSDMKLAGHSTSPTVVDWNSDNVPDLLIGAEDGHFYYIENFAQKK